MKREAPLPTPHNTVFDGNRPLLIGYPAILRLAQDFTLAKSPTVFASEIRHIAYDLEQSGLLEELIDSKITAEVGRKRPESGEEIARLRRLKELLDEPSPYAHIRMRFEKHSIGITDYESAKANFTKQMEMVFKKGETNIIFFESGATINNFDKTFQTGFKKYRSFVKAYSYGNLLTENQSRPSDGQVFIEALSFPERIKRKTAANPNDKNMGMLYHMAFMETADKLLEDGYRIRPVFENFERLRRDEDEAVRFVKGDMKRVLAKAPERDVKVVQDILDLVSNADSTKAKTNILLMRGRIHLSMGKTLPNNLKPITEISVDEKELEELATMQLYLEIMKILEIV